MRHLQLKQYLCAEIGIGMKQIFLIDYENVGLAGLTGISKLGSDDDGYLLFGRHFGGKGDFKCLQGPRCQD